MISSGSIFLLLIAFLLVLLQYSGNPFFSNLGANGLLGLVISVLIYSVGYELWNQWPLPTLRLPGYFLLWPS